MGHWATLSEAAEERNLSKKTIRRMVDDGRLQSRKQNGCWEVFLDEHTGKKSSSRVRVTPIGSLESLLQVFEDLQTLQVWCAEHGIVWRMLEASGLLPQELTLLHWAKLHDRIRRSSEAMNSLCKTMTLEFSTIQSVYEDILTTQSLWFQYLGQLGTSGVGERTSSQIDDDDEGEHMLFRKILDNLRKLVVASTPRS